MATRTELAEHLFTSDRTITDLRKAGAIPEPRGRAGYDLDACRRQYLEYLRGLVKRNETAAGAGDPDQVERLRNQDDILKEKARLAAEQANKIAMENAQRRRELAPIALLAEYAERCAVHVRAGLEALPAQLKRALPFLRAADLQVVKREVARLSDGIADFTDTSGAT